MYYMSAAEAAKQWAVGLRLVQRLLAAGRIPGVKKHGRSWLIPIDARKPTDLCRCLLCTESRRGSQAEIAGIDGHRPPLRLHHALLRIGFRLRWPDRAVPEAASP